MSRSKTASVYYACLLSAFITSTAFGQDVTTQSNATPLTSRSDLAASLQPTASVGKAGKVDTLTITIAERDFTLYRRWLTANSFAVDTAQPLDLGADETINNRCLLDFHVKRASDPNLISLGCHGGLRSRQLLTEAGIKEYLGGFRTGTSASLTLDDDQAGLYTDLASDNLYLSARMGFARLGFGALVNSTEEAADDPEGDTESEEAAGSTVSQFYQGGGNASMYLALPAYYFRNYVQAFESRPAQFVRKADVFVALMVSGDVPDMGSTVENGAWNARLGLQGTGTQTTFADVFNIYIHLDGSAGWGSDQFFENLDVDTESSVFAVGKVELGVDINKLIRIGMTTGVSTMGADLPWRLSLKLLRAE